MLHCGFLTDHNVSLAGSIYDLDSVYGRAVGDNRDPDFKDDLNEFQRDAYKIFYPRGRDSNFFSRTYGERFGPKFFQAFTERYLDISTQEITTSQFLEDFHQLMTQGMADAKSQGLSSQTVLAELEKAEKENPNFIIDEFTYWVGTRLKNNYWNFFHNWEPALFREDVGEGIKSSFDKILDQRVAQLDITDQMQQELRKETVKAAKELDKVPSAV